MDGVLSQEEINALLNQSNAGSDDPAPPADAPEPASETPGNILSDVEKDAIGEIANISMGTAATTLFSLVNQKVDISTPVVREAGWDDVSAAYERPCVFIQIGYTVGLDGSNVLVLKENDVKIITDLMMGGDGTNIDGELSELHLSAICEAMNQMMGSSATSLSSMLNKKIDISPPSANVVDFDQDIMGEEIDPFLAGRFVSISFKMKIGELIDSDIIQLYPYSFARDMFESYKKNMMDGQEEEAPAPEPEAAPQAAAQPAPQPQMATPTPDMAQSGAAYGMPVGVPPGYGMPYGAPYGAPAGYPQGYAMPQQPVNVQPAQFQAFDPSFNPMQQHENIDLIMDVPLEVTVELGRTTKSIQDILDFSPGTIIELNKIAGEPIDVLVNGKYVAKGEVVVIEESFGIRVTEIVKERGKE
ncbi:MAG: flagellar motor switch phosphatase FliY [Lachnospiraceae bacterium]|nr:flagellar motor switch phosphatase FliY [Lachnospiraceae bacterium]